MKQRLDAILVSQGLAHTTDKAKALVMAGQVFVGQQRVSAPSTLIDESQAIEIAERPPYVGRGGEKLVHALRVFSIDVSGVVAADIGSSTGGFTDCLLQNGAARVYAVDVGKGQLDYGLRQDPRVVAMEGVNARHLDALPEVVDLMTVDVSFISLRLVLPAALRWMRREADMVALFKPQFEARKQEVPRGGVIRDSGLHAQLIGRFAGWCVANRFRIRDVSASPIPGASGNREFLFWLRASS